MKDTTPYCPCGLNEWSLTPYGHRCKECGLLADKELSEELEKYFDWRWENEDDSAAR